MLKFWLPIRSQYCARTIRILAPTTANFHFAVAEMSSLFRNFPFSKHDQPAIDNPTSFFQSTISRLRARQDEVEHVRFWILFPPPPRLQTLLSPLNVPFNPQNICGACSRDDKKTYLVAIANL